MRRDYKVLFRTEETIAGIARAYYPKNQRPDFNIVRWFLGVLCQDIKLRPIKVVFDVKEGEPLAYVTYKPRTLHIDREVWDLADQGDPEARYIVAHEVGHLILHDHTAQAFSDNESIRLRFESQKEHSAEWQADRFADHFLIPTVIAETIRNRAGLMQLGVTGEVADRRLAAIAAPGPLRVGCTDEPCPKCCNFSMKGVGLYLRCGNCGATLNRYGF